VRFTPELVELIFPSEDHPETPLAQRAIYTEDMVREALQQLGGVQGEALAILLGLNAGTLGTTLEERRRQAAALLNILPDTFRRKRHEGLLLWDLTMEVYRISLPRGKWFCVGLRPTAIGTRITRRASSGRVANGTDDLPQEPTIQ